MFRWTFICFLFITGSILCQSADSRRVNLPPGQLLVHDEPIRSSDVNALDNYMQKRFHFPDYLPVTVSSKNIYFLKYISQVDVFDKQGKLTYTFEFSPRGELQNGTIKSDHLVRWLNHRLSDSVEVRVEAHYDKQGRLAKRDSSITTSYKLEPADTVVSYTSSSHWIYLSGAVVNERNNYYNETYYKKRVSIPGNGLNAQYDQRTTKGSVYLKKKLPVNYKEDSIYMDRFFQQDKNFAAMAYSDTGKTEIYQQLPSSHYIKKRYHPVTNNTYGTAGADFKEPGLNADDDIDFMALGQLTLGGRIRRSPDHYKCTLTRRKLIDSIFVAGKGIRASDTLASLIYTVRYHYYPMAYFSGNEYEEEPQIILREQDGSYGKTYYQANFNKYYPVRSGNSIWLGDVTAFVKNRVKTIHVYYGRDELQAFELDTAGKIIGGMEGSGNHRWKGYTDKNGNRISGNEYYNGYAALESKDSSVYIPKTIRHKDTAFTYQRMESFSYKRGALINERNRNYNEEYLNKRIKSTEVFATLRALDRNDPKGKKEGYIYLKEPLKTNYKEDQVYLCVRGTGDYGFKVTKDTTDITDRIPANHRVRKQLINPEVIKKLVSGEDFNPPYSYRGPICGGSGYDYRSYNESSYDGTIFHSFSWTLNSKGLYDTCYKTDPIIPRYPGKNNKAGSEDSSKKAPQKYALYTVRYEYF